MTLGPCFASACLLAQGALLKRHSATLAGGAPLRPADLALGAPVALYGRAFQLVDADSFTRAWLAARGTPAGDALPYPEGAIEARARRRREAAAGAGPRPRPALRAGWRLPAVCCDSIRLGAVRLVLSAMQRCVSAGGMCHYNADADLHIAAILITLPALLSIPTAVLLAGC